MGTFLAAKLLALRGRAGILYGSNIKMCGFHFKFTCSLSSIGLQRHIQFKIEQIEILFSVTLLCPQLATFPLERSVSSAEKLLKWAVELIILYALCSFEK